MICVTGAESTGKTTLAEFLAATLAAPLVTEQARDYLAGQSGYHQNDVLAIARQQQAAEERALAAAPLVIADTDLTVIRVWWEEKYGELHPWIANALSRRTERRYLLPRPDLPWEFDPLRESPHDRPRLHRRYLELLTQGPFAFSEVSGTGQGRLDSALAQVRSWLS